MTAAQGEAAMIVREAAANPRRTETTPTRKATMGGDG